MNGEEFFSELIDEEEYQVFLFVCPGSVPFNFASHPWFVLNKKGVISRWEVLSRMMPHETKWGHLYKDFFSPFRGIEILPFLGTYFWRGKLLGEVEGATAMRMIEFIENSPVGYPYSEEFVLSGPNSNTYAQWVLDNFLEFKARLPWNSFGKHYKIERSAQGQDKTISSKPD